MVNICIVYELSASGSFSDDPTLKTPCLVRLDWLKILILTSIDITVLELGLIEKEVFNFMAVDFVEM